MGRTETQKTTGHGKDIFITGEYVQHFKPDDKKNPFYKIYGLKKQDTVNIINKLNGLKRILDIGGGMGRLSWVLAQSLKNKVILTDISIYMLKLAMKNSGNLKNIEVVNADAHNLPFPDSSFDVIVGLDILCHLEEPEKSLREFYRILTADGTLILDSTNSNPLWALFYPRYMGKNPVNWIKIMKFKGILPGWEKIVRHYPRKKFLSLLNDTGFKVVQILNYGPSICPKWYLAVSRKIA